MISLEIATFLPHSYQTLKAQNTTIARSDVGTSYLLLTAEKMLTAAMIATQMLDAICYEIEVHNKNSATPLKRRSESEIDALLKDEAALREILNEVFAREARRAYENSVSGITDKDKREQALQERIKESVIPTLQRRLCDVLSEIHREKTLSAHNFKEYLQSGFELNFSFHGLDDFETNSLTNGFIELARRGGLNFLVSTDKILVCQQPSANGMKTYSSIQLPSENMKRLTFNTPAANQPSVALSVKRQFELSRLREHLTKFEVLCAHLGTQLFSTLDALKLQKAELQKTKDHVFMPASSFALYAKKLAALEKKLSETQQGIDALPAILASLLEQFSNPETPFSLEEQLPIWEEKMEVPSQLCEKAMAEWTTLNKALANAIQRCQLSQQAEQAWHEQRQRAIEALAQAAKEAAEFEQQKQTGIQNLIDSQTPWLNRRIGEIYNLYKAAIGKRNLGEYDTALETLSSVTKAASSVKLRPNDDHYSTLHIVTHK